MKKLALLCMGAVLAAGCVAVPFQEPELLPVGSDQPKTLVERFQAAQPESFQLLNSIVFEYNWRTFSGIGYLDVDRQSGVFQVVCLNPMGVKLFELSGDQRSVTNRYTIEAFSRYGDVTTAVGTDIRRIYFDLVPAPDARAGKRTYTVSFRQPFGDGILEYIFAGKTGDLIEKNYYAENGLAWRASYYEYRDQNGKRWPQGILYLNYQYGYRLTIRQKELRLENH